MDKRKFEKLNFTDMSEHEKNRLKRRITNSIFTYSRRRRRIIYGIGLVAASFLIFMSIGIFNITNNDSSPIESFVDAQDTKEGESSGNVKLILYGDQYIDIAEDDSTILYSNTGQDIIIGKTRSINQDNYNSKEIVFNTLIVPYGRRANIELSDGSKIWLNSGSKFIFPATFEEDKREVYLEGEGIFEVNRDKNRPFFVKAYNHEIEVLGTVFNISNYTDENTISTVLKSGSVQINLKNGSFFNSKESIKITPGTLAVYDKSDMEVIIKKVEIEKYFSWRDGIYIFKNAPMQSIMKKISRYYNIEIIINDAYLANQTFSGYLDVKDTVENVLNTIKETTEFEYHITENNKLIIN
jgi:hypothetical protein